MQHPLTFPQRVFDTLLWIRPTVLNPDSRPPTAEGDLPLVVRMRERLNTLKTEAIDPNTGNVDYASIAASESYRDYRALTAELRQFDLATLVTREEKLAFWLNLYNALIIDGIIRYGLRRRVNEVWGFFRRVAYNVGGYRFSTDDIEHGILRANAGHPAIPGPQFGKHDPRRKLILEQTDYRIHFALVCGARSCPPIRFYAPDQIDAQLDLAASNFLEQTVEVDLHKNRVTLSKILQWYGRDFGAGFWTLLGLGDKCPILHAIHPHLLDEQKREVLHQQASNLQVKFKPYDWALNRV